MNNYTMEKGESFNVFGIYSAALHFAPCCPNRHCERSETKRGNLKIKERSPRRFAPRDDKKRTLEKELRLLN